MILINIPVCDIILVDFFYLMGKSYKRLKLIIIILSYKVEKSVIYITFLYTTLQILIY